MQASGVGPQLLNQILRDGRSAWPEVRIMEDDVRKHLDALPTQIQGGEPGQLSSADLYLAVACALGNDQAMACFEHQFLLPLTHALRSVDPDPAFVDEVKQALRLKLFVGGPDRHPKIRDYSGRGPLLGWLKVAALRTALNLRRAPAPTVSLTGSLAEALPLDALDPETALLRARHQKDFEAALFEALTTLSTRERRVLRLHVLEGCNVGQIGALFQVDRSTVTRWIVRARRLLLSGTRERLRQKLDLRDSELDSLMRTLQGDELHASVGRYLQELTGE
jgi:RNA polymerase sigma-70 factor, ECF subfamily